MHSGWIKVLDGIYRWSSVDAARALCHGLLQDLNLFFVLMQLNLLRCTLHEQCFLLVAFQTFQLPAVSELHHPDVPGLLDVELHHIRPRFATSSCSTLDNIRIMDLRRPWSVSFCALRLWGRPSSGSPAHEIAPLSMPAASGPAQLWQKLSTRHMQKRTCILLVASCFVNAASSRWFVASTRSSAFQALPAELHEGNPAEGP